MSEVKAKYLTARGTGTTVMILNRVKRERARQRQLLAEGHIHIDVSSDKVSETSKLPILAEGFGGVAKEIAELGEKSFFATEARQAIRKKMQVKLIQLAAVAVAWAEALDKNERT